MLIGFILGVSVALQFAAAVLAARLIPMTGRRPGWLCITGALALSAVGQLVALARHLQRSPSDLAAALIAVAAVAVLVAGVLLVAPLLREAAEHPRLVAQRDAAVASERERRDMIEHVVHDMKNPLAAIKGNVQFLRGLQQDADGKDAAEDSVDAAESLHRMLLNILDIIRAEQGTLQLRPEEFQIDQLLEAVVRQFSRRILEKQIRLERDVQLDQPTLHWDPHMLSRILENLVDNALKYSPPGTRVGVGVTLEHGEVQLDVRDEGPGIPAETRERVFDKYVRLDRDTAIEARISRGLGLAFCRQAVEAHGGRIWVEDNSPRGARFRVRLPTAKSEAPPAKPAPSSP